MRAIAASICLRISALEGPGRHCGAGVFCFVTLPPFRYVPVDRRLPQQRQVGDEVKGFVFTAHAGAVDEVDAKRFYRQRHKIENFFCRVKDWRRIATRYDKLARNFLAATLMIGTLYWIKL